MCRWSARDIMDMLLGGTTYSKKQRNGDTDRQGMGGKVDVQGSNSCENKIHIIKYFTVCLKKNLQTHPLISSAKYFIRTIVVKFIQTCCEVYE